MEDIDVIGVEDAFLINGSNMKVDDKLSGCVSNKENDGEPIFKELTLQVVMEEITSLKHLLYEVLNKQDCHFKETADEIVGLKTSCDSIQASIETLENIVKLKVNGPSSNDDKSQFVDPYLLNAQQRFNEDLSQIVYEHDFTEKDPMDEEVADVVASKINSSTLVYKPPSLPERWLKANTTCNTKKSAKQTALITKSDLKKNSHFKLEVKFACKPTYDMILAKRQPQVCAYLFQKTSDAKLMAEILVVVTLATERITCIQVDRQQFTDRQALWCLPPSFVFDFQSSMELPEIREKYYGHWMPPFPNFNFIYVPFKCAVDHWFMMIVHLKNEVIYHLDTYCPGGCAAYRHLNIKKV
ncbi:Ulp1 protease family carboxy-terminal domain protein, partial [Trifolium pratense]